MNNLSQFEIKKRVKLAHESAIAMSILCGIFPMIDIFRGEYDLWMSIPILYSIIILICAYMLSKRKYIGGVIISVTLPFFYFMFMQHSVAITFPVFAGLYLIINGTYAIFKSDRQSISLSSD